ncbi:CopG family ribbon-helix-helix protein [Desulfonatronum thioautotrophicum]|uniref:CopG family ribbon-helix-helix protein n=1 Tax=Desulfonatronum thioautotrophicum TaxID=617001 RepID=UPI0005EBA0A2|nr:ribbon-helix-helix domain-containing protein [Desulfonatronum thioautotrophicum]
MQHIELLRKKQVGLRLPEYLVQELDELSAEYDLNRSEIIHEAIRAYLEEQKSRRFYSEFEQAAKELKAVVYGDACGQSLQDLIHELEDQ